jgi:hypothetical protein
MSDETKVEQSENADDNSVSQPIAKPTVVGSQSQNEIVIYQDGVEISELAKTRNTLENMLGENPKP